MLLHTTLSAQDLAPTLLTPAGGMESSTSGSLSWSLGEIAITHVRVGSALLTEGFQQIESDTTLTVLPTDPRRLQILLPNLITPNGDGQNDVFDPVSVLEGYRYYVPRSQTELLVLNRWGEVVFRKSPYERWESSNLPQSTYYFRLRRTDSGHIITEGAIHLLR